MKNIIKTLMIMVSVFNIIIILIPEHIEDHKYILTIAINTLLLIGIYLYITTYNNNIKKNFITLQLKLKTNKRINKILEIDDINNIEGTILKYIVSSYSISEVGNITDVRYKYRGKEYIIDI